MRRTLNKFSIHGRDHHWKCPVTLFAQTFALSLWIEGSGKRIILHKTHQRTLLGLLSPFLTPIFKRKDGPTNVGEDTNSNMATHCTDWVKAIVKTPNSVNSGGSSSGPQSREAINEGISDESCHSMTLRLFRPSLIQWRQSKNYSKISRAPRLHPLVEEDHQFGLQTRGKQMELLEGGDYVELWILSNGP
jgi:hypothetical protein